MSTRAAVLKKALRLEPHPEGGSYRRVYTSTSTLLYKVATRPAITAIHYPLCAGEISRWHRIDADEIWQHSEGDAIELLLFDADQRELHRHRLGRSDASNATAPLLGVPAGCWQCARPLGDYALVHCAVAPGFDFAGFDLLDAAPEVAAALAALDLDLLRYR